MSTWTLRAALGLAGVVAASVSLGLLGLHTQRRLDLAGRAAFRLSDRTTALVADPAAPAIEIILALDDSARDRRIADTIADVADALDRAGPNLRVTRLDIGSPGGRDRFDALIAALRERDAPLLDAAADAVRGAEAELARHAETLTTLAPELAPSQAAVARTLATDLGVIIGEAATRRERAQAEPVPNLAEPVQILRGAAAALADQLGRLAGDAPARTAASVRSLRDRASLLVASLDALATPDVVRISGLLARGEAIIVSRARVAGDAGPALAGVDVGSLVPDEVTEVAAAFTQIRERSEASLAAAIASISRRDRPIVVLLHGQWAALAGRPGISAALAARLDAAGIPMLDWAAARGDDPPSTAAIDPGGERPVVYVVHAADTWSQPAQLPDGTSMPSGVERARRVAEAARSLIDAGKPVLLCMQPSVLPTFGDIDPMSQLAEGLGVSADLGRVILDTVMAPAGSRASPRLRVTPPEREGGGIASAIAGLPINLDWPVGLTANEPWRVTPILEIDNTGTRWAESQWLTYLRTPSAQRDLITPQPAFDGDQGDGDQGDARGPWLAAAAVETPARGRAVIVGCGGWVFDPAWTDEAGAVTAPGNIELFEASLAWLAGQDVLAGASGTPASLPRIKPMTSGALSAMRWALIAGLPLLILAGGTVYGLRRRG